jgi:polyribonucleotide nucleotidyltransferase
VQVVIHVLSLNPEVQADIAAMIGTSAALAISGIPFNGPIGAARVGYINGEYVLNPGKTAAGRQPAGPGGGRHRSRRADGGVRGRPAERRGDAGRRGLRPRQGKIAINAINELVRDAGKPEWDWQPPAKDEAFIAKVTELAEARCARPTRSAASRPAPRPAATPPPT